MGSRWNRFFRRPRILCGDPTTCIAPQGQDGIAFGDDTGGGVKTICVIPVRYGSTRFPGKALALIAGKPLIQHVVERASKAQVLDRVIVATDDDRIEAAVSCMGPAGGKNGVRTERTRKDHPSGTDRIAEVMHRHPADIVVNLQGDEPMIDPELVNSLVNLFREDPDLEMATAKVRITDPEAIRDPNCVKVVTDKEGFALYFSRSPIPYYRDKADPDSKGGDRPRYYKHLGLYAYRRAFLLKLAAWPVTELEQAEQLEQLRALAHGVRIRVIETSHDSIGVDTPRDLETLKRLWPENISS